MSNIRLNIFAGDDQSIFSSVFGEINAKHIVERIWDKDYTVWSKTPDEVSNRLGWLNSTKATLTSLSEIEEFVHAVKVEGFTNVLLLGMGGSSLAPEVFRKIFGVGNDCLDLSVLDSTDPGMVLEYSEKLDPAKTLYIVSTKSGGTVETLSLMKYFYTFAAQNVGIAKVGKHFTAITDPGSGLESMARQLNFRKIFINDPDIGGRYSALSLFGMVPAALIGVDLRKLLGETELVVKNSQLSIDKNLSAQLGVIIGVMAKQGRDKLTFIMSEEIAPLGAWIEQLIAESTGKNGKGILPVMDESITAADQYSNDRLFVHLKMEDDKSSDTRIEEIRKAGFPVIEISLADGYQLGAQFFMWEFATVIAGWYLDIQPFDQPDVESAKIVAREKIKNYQLDGELKTSEPAFYADGIKIFSDDKFDSIDSFLKAFFGNINSGMNDDERRSYVSIQAFIKSGDAISNELKNLCAAIEKKYKVVVTLGFGPRFLHSTGQLHKGDAGNGLFIQLLADMPKDVSIPNNPGAEESSVTFGVLKTAQAMGDREALVKKGRKIITIDLGENIVGGIKTISQNI